MNGRFCGLIVMALMVCAVPAQGQNFLESFESGLPLPAQNHDQGPPGESLTLSSGVWFALNLSNPLGTVGVFQGDPGIVPPAAGAGATYAAMSFQDGSGFSNINTYLMSPVRTFNNGDTISFITIKHASSFPDRMSLRLSLNGASTDAADFTTVLLTINPNLTTVDYPTTWTPFNVTLSGLSGPTSGRFAFNYDVPNGGPDGTNSDYIGIDLASFTGASVPEPATWMMIGSSLVMGCGYFYRRSRAKIQASEALID